MASQPNHEDSPLRAGDTLAGRYRLSRLLGEGGMGYVWEGRQITTDKPIAIKVLKGTSSVNAARFLREARLSASLTHRNIVQVFDFWESEGDGPIFMVMELLRGETLGVYLSRAGRLSVEETRVIGLAVAGAIRAAHAAGIVHRDLKPENVYLAHAGDDPAPEIKVLDFGIARATFVDAEATSVTRTGSVIGTPHYMAPEQIFGEKDIDGRADIWSLGVILYECLTGTKPFDGENFGQIFRRVTQGEVAPLAEVAPAVPAPFSALVMSMLSTDRSKRPTSATIYEALNSPVGFGAAPQPVQFTQWLPPPPRASQISSLSPSSFSRPPWTPPGAPLVTRPSAVQTGLSALVPLPKQGSPLKTIAIAAGAVALLALAGVTLLLVQKPQRAPVDFGSLPVASDTAPAASTVILPASTASTPAAPEEAPPASAKLAEEPPRPISKLPAPGPKAEPRPLPRAEANTPPPLPKVRPAPTMSSDPLSGGRF